ATNLAPGACDFTLQNDIAASGPIQEEIIAGVSVSPNPADTYAEAIITLAKSATITTKIYNLSGELIMSLGAESYPAGTTTVNYNIRSLMPGTYLVVFESGFDIKSAKLVVI
ncbi:MAG: T9SS type A sorting domain-containing protein, partial [Chitinophagales bacterium]